MDALHEVRIQEVKDLLKRICHVAIATVNEDGSPHNTPVFAGITDDLKIFWASHPNAAHSQNVARSGQAFIVLFDSMNKGAGLYIKAAARKVQAEMFDEGLEIFNSVRSRHGRDIVAKHKFSDTVQALYCAEPLELWINAAERDQDGNIIRDYRFEVSVKDLQDINAVGPKV